MKEILKSYSPAEVENLLDEMFTGYINSPMCCIGYLGDMYELKRLITNEAKNRTNEPVTRDHARVEELVS